MVASQVSEQAMSKLKNDLAEIKDEKRKELETVQMKLR
jgi:hypothetical protein